MVTSLYTTKRNIKAQVKSSTRVDWINKTIELSADLIEQYRNISDNITAIYEFEREALLMKKSLYSQPLNDSSNHTSAYLPINQIDKQLNDQYNNVQKSNHTIVLLELYMMTSSNDKNVQSSLQFMRDKQESLYEYLLLKSDEIKQEVYDEEDIDEFIDTYFKMFSSLSNAISDFQSHLSRYLSYEWNQIE